MSTASPFVEEADEGLAQGLDKLGLCDFTGRWSLAERLEKTAPLSAPLSLWLFDWETADDTFGDLGNKSPIRSWYELK